MCRERGNREERPEKNRRPGGNPSFLIELSPQICVPDERAMAEARRRWDAIAKPLGSLGRWEDVIVKIAGMQRTSRVNIDKKALVVFCADNGVVAEGVSQSGAEVTAAVARNFLAGRTCTCLIAAKAGADVYPVDIGMIADTGLGTADKIRRGTGNIRREDAMSRSEALAAVETGRRMARKLAADGCRILATGEMGIGNTTTSTAIAAVLLQADPAEITGRGAGLPEEAFQRKKVVIREAIRERRPDPEDPVDILAKLGGLDIAGLVGVFLGGAECGIPVVIDGLISAAAAALAVRICPLCRDYMLASHRPSERAGERLLDSLKLHPWLDCGLRLGEGSGAVALFPLLDMALEIYRHMDSFEQIGIEAYHPWSSSPEGGEERGC